jgi:hypothetical protein
MMPRFVQKIICRVPIKTIEISDKRSRAVRSKYPLLDRVLTEFRQSRICKDRRAECRDACTDPSTFELRGVDEKKAGSDLLDDHAIDLERASRLLRSPVEAFRLAQIWRRARHKKIERFGRAFRERFFEEIKTLVPPECAERWAEA